MELAIVLRTFVLYVHLLAVCAALGAILIQDFALLLPRRLDVGQLRGTMSIVTAALVVLWLTGLGLIWMDTQGAFAVLLEKPKLMAKLCVVVILTLNGVLLHKLAVPCLVVPSHPSQGKAGLCAALGAVSTVSWLFALFLGIAKPVEAYLGVSGFLVLYGALLLAGLLFAVALIRVRVFKLMTLTSLGHERGGAA